MSFTGYRGTHFVSSVNTEALVLWSSVICRLELKNWI